MKNMWRRTIAMAILFSLVLLAGCETVRGFGKDMKRAGNWIERESAK